LLLSFAVMTGGAAAIVACSSEGERNAFEEPEADSGKPNLPEAAPPTSEDGASPADAGAEDAKPPFDPTDETVTCADDAGCAVQLVAGENHFCARMSDGTARCWGDNAKGSLGTRDAGTAPEGTWIGDAGADGGTVPGTGFVVSNVVGLEGATQLSAGGTTTCTHIVPSGRTAPWRSFSDSSVSMTSIGTAPATSTSVGITVLRSAFSTRTIHSITSTSASAIKPPARAACSRGSCSIPMCHASL